MILIYRPNIIKLNDYNIPLPNHSPTSERIQNEIPCPTYKKRPDCSGRFPVSLQLFPYRIIVLQLKPFQLLVQLRGDPLVALLAIEVMHLGGIGLQVI